MSHDIHTARVYLAQVRAFRLRGSSAAWLVTLLDWAAKRRRAATRAQRELFTTTRNEMAA